MRLKSVVISIVVVGLAGYGALKLYAFYRAKKNFQQILYCAGMPHVPLNAPPRSRVFDYDHISASLFGPVGIKGIKYYPSPGEEVDIGELRLAYDYDGDLKTCPTPKHIKLSIDGLSMNVSLLDKLAKQQAAYRAQHGLDADAVPDLVSQLGLANLYTQATHLRQLGYRHLNMNVSFDLRFDKAKKAASFDLAGNIDKLGKFNFAITLADMAKNINSAVLGVKLQQAELEYFDDSYVPRLFKMFAAENKQDVATYRKQLIAGLDTDLSSRQIKLGQDSINNLKAFLAHPKHLIVTMYPYEPVGLKSIKLYKPGDVPMLLNVQIYTKSVDTN